VAIVVASKGRLGGEDGEPDCKPQYDRRGESGGEESEQESDRMGSLRRRDTRLVEIIEFTYNLPS
jgi:hypothetical protein